MSVSNRIIAGFAAITAILLVLGLYALQQLGTMNDGVDRIVRRDFAAVTQVDEASAAIASMREAREGAMIARLAQSETLDIDTRRLNERTQAAQTALSRIRTSAQEHAETAVTGTRSALWRRLAASITETQRAFDEVRATGNRQMAQLAAGRTEDATAVGLEADRQHEPLSRALADTRTVLAETLDAGRDATRESYERTRLSILVGLLLAIVISVAIAIAIRRSITGPLNEFMGFAGRIGEGDLTGSAHATGRDELGRLGTTLNTMVGGLRDLALRSRDATENLNAAATEIRASTQEQAASVEEQLAAVQETAATVDEITHSGAQITRRAQEVIAAAQATAQISDTGLAAVGDTARAMDLIRDQAQAVASNIVALSENTQAIGDIISTVNDVSERSHLLALNASIEAAAAGEQGRSFAIVATELKALADQAKSATRNVRSILGDIQRGINASVMLTEEAVKRVASGKERTDAGYAAIEELAERVQENVQTFQQIVASTNQQQIGIEQVTIALQNIRQASQQTAASTRQLDQAGGDLTSLSRTLVGLTERYRV